MKLLNSLGYFRDKLYVWLEKSSGELTRKKALPGYLISSQHVKKGTVTDFFSPNFSKHSIQKCKNVLFTWQISLWGGKKKIIYIAFYD